MPEIEELPKGDISRKSSKTGGLGHSIVNSPKIAICMFEMW